MSAHNLSPKYYRGMSFPRQFMEFLRPHRTVPRVPWTAPSPWSLSLRRVLILIFGLAIFGLGESFLVQGNLGNSPWTVLADGLSRHSALSMGWATFFISAAVLALWIPLREKPGFGTIANIFVIALFLQLGLDFIPKSHNVVVGVLLTFAGIATIGLGSAFYITTGLGRGPRDGLMTSLHHKTGIRVGRMRLVIELCALSIGAALGGHIGIATLLFASSIGYSVAAWFNIFDRVLNPR